MAGTLAPAATQEVPGIGVMVPPGELANDTSNWVTKERSRLPLAPISRAPSAADGKELPVTVPR